MGFCWFLLVVDGDAMAEKAAGTGPHDDPGRRTWCASSPAPRTRNRTIDTKWFHGAIFVCKLVYVHVYNVYIYIVYNTILYIYNIYLSVSLFTQRAICIWIPVNTGAWVKRYKTNSLTQKYSGNSSSPSSWISIGLEPFLGVQVETILGLCLLSLARQLGCFCLNEF